MAQLVFKIYIDKKFYKTFEGKEIKEYFLEWNEKLRQEQIIKTPDGKVKVISAATENPKNNNGNVVTEIQLEKI